MLIPSRTGAVGLALVLATPLGAQIRASERGTVSQVIDGTEIALEYSRPTARGRDPLFGGVVHWDEVWTPGANWATTFESSRPVWLNETRIPAGRYSVWMIPAETGPWTVFLDEEHRLFHTQKPGEEDDQIRFQATPVGDGPHMETLAWYLPEVRRAGAELRMHWGRTIVPLDLRVTPSVADMTLDDDVAAPFLGAYSIVMVDEERGESPEMPLEMVHEDGKLVGRVEGMFDFQLLPTEEPHRFGVGIMQDGELFDVEPEATWIFELDGAEVTGFRLLGLDDALWGRGTKGG